MGYRVWICSKCKRYMGEQIKRDGGFDPNLNLGGSLHDAHKISCSSITIKERFIDKYD